MLINGDLSARTLVHGAKLDWVPSPTKGVERRMLFRIGDERARATSIVRYAPHSRFPRHGHPGGEEFIVLEGTFQDETGDFPVGSYVRNPPDSSHSPGSESGCTIFVKLWQFQQNDREHIIRLPSEGEPQAFRSGIASSRLLFEGADERVFLEDWKPNAAVDVVNDDGLELLVLTGAYACDGQLLDRLTWLRLPAGEPLHAFVGPDGARVWYKAAPLMHKAVCVLASDASPLAGRT